GLSGKYRQGDARGIGPGRQDIERSIARTGQSCRSFSESTWREQQVFILHGVAEMSAALTEHSFGLSVLFVGDVEPAGKFVALELAQKVPMVTPFPGKATRELVIIDAPAHGLELFKRLSEIEIGNLRAGLRERACGLFEESFRVLFRAVPEHGAAKADLELVD